jgi:hypothetical protein
MEKSNTGPIRGRDTMMVMRANALGMTPLGVPGGEERFTTAEVAALRNDLLQSGVDHWQAAEMLSVFLTGRGYGISRQNARDAVSRMETAGCSVECMQRELEQLALVM